MIRTSVLPNSELVPYANLSRSSLYYQPKQPTVDLGDPGRFETLGELVYEIYRLVWIYNNTRIHTALKMAPVQFAAANKSDTIKHMEKVS
ncbi:MAG: hypothetical protein L6Q29_01525 [Candidatus Pacebacteria bacterium]|nr:hypothetical protein [Candidatus Paceibacterota bacterium]